MDLPSESDESDVDFVPDEKDGSDVGSDAESSSKNIKNNKTKGKRPSSEATPVTRSKRSKEEDGKKEIEKNEIDHTVDKKHEDDLWASFLTPNENTPVPKVEESVSKQSNDDTGCSLEPSKNETKPIPAIKKQTPLGNRGAGGLSSVLNKLGKGNKLSTLQKSQLDWKNFKQAEGIEEELSTHNRGRDGYLERQDFLQRTDFRQFEIEKQIRSTRRSNR